LRSRLGRNLPLRRLFRLPAEGSIFGQTNPMSSVLAKRSQRRAELCAASQRIGENCGRINVRLHRGEMARATRRRPNLLRDRLCAQPRPLVEAGIGPDVHESRHRAGDRMHRREQWRYFCAAGRPLAPKLDGRRHAVRLEDIGFARNSPSSELVNKMSNSTTSSPQAAGITNAEHR
jgi:hypothetical protein